MSQSPRKRSPDGGFRGMLFLGAVVSGLLGVMGVIWTGLLESVLGINIISGSGGPAYLYGGVMIAVAVGYLVAASNPSANRGLLVPLFLVPFITALVTIAGVARDEISGKGYFFAIAEFAYCFFYFRFYPRVRKEQAPKLPTS